MAIHEAKYLAGLAGNLNIYINIFFFFYIIAKGYISQHLFMAFVTICHSISSLQNIIINQEYQIS